MDFIDGISLKDLDPDSYSDLKRLGVLAKFMEAEGLMNFYVLPSLTSTLEHYLQRQKPRKCGARGQNHRF